MATPSYAQTPYKPTRFPGGITNAYPTEAFADLGKPLETKFYTDFEDFFVYTAAQWSVGGAPTAAAAAGAGGVLSVTVVTGAEATFRRSVASFTMVAGKQAFFAFKAQSADIVNSIFWAGLFNAGATPATATDGMYFNKPDAVSTFTASIRQDATTGAQNTAAVGALVNDTPFVIALVYDGKQTVEVYQDNNKVATLTASSAYLPNVNLQLAFGVDDGAAGSGEILLVDYIYAAIER
jgi:hypothetical protein